MTKKKYDRKPRFQRLYAGLLGKALAVVFAVAALQLTVCAAEPVKPDFPAGVPSEAVWLIRSDGKVDDVNYYSLLTNYPTFWSDGAMIQDTDTDKVCFIPAGLSARTGTKAATVVPIIFCSGCVWPRASGGLTTSFNDLKLLDGGYIRGNQVGIKAGNITILAEDPDNPAFFLFERDKAMEKFSLQARLVGSENSQLLYTNDLNSAKGFLELDTDSDWSEFKGTLRVAGGLGILSVKSVPNNFAGAVRFGRNGILSMKGASAPYSFGELSFTEGGAITNTGSGSTLTVTGTFDTGKNCNWLSRNAGTFGTLKLGDGFSLIDDQESPTTVLTIMKKLEVGKNISIEYPNVSPFNGAEKSKVLLMKLAPEAVQAGVPDLSGIVVSFTALDSGASMQLTMEDDPDVSGGLVVYATPGQVVYYNGPSEFANREYMGKWIDPTVTPSLWDDGLYPSGSDKIYCTTQDVYVTSSGVTTFPGRTLVVNRWIYLNSTSSYVTNLWVSNYGLYGREDNLHFGGNITGFDELTIRGFESESFYLDAALHGDSTIFFESYYPGAGKGSTFYLTADNSDWTGVLRSKWSDRESGKYPANETNHTRIVVDDAKALGGDSATFTYNMIRVGNYTEIRFTKTTAYMAPNRGIYIDKGFLNVDEGATVELKMPVTQRGPLYKIGIGTLYFGGGIRFSPNSDLADQGVGNATSRPTLVREGAIKGSSLSGAFVTFSDGTGIAADTVSGAMDLTGATVTVEGTIYLKADGNTLPEPTQNVTYPIVKVSAAQAAELGDKFKAARSPWRGWPVTLVSETDADGNVTYSVKYEKKGFVMSIR